MLQDWFPRMVLNVNTILPGPPQHSTDDVASNACCETRTLHMHSCRVGSNHQIIFSHFSKNWASQVTGNKCFEC